MENKSSEESIAFRRRDDLPGVEVMDAEHCSRKWRWFHTSFGLTLIRSWHGEAHYRHRSHAVVPGMVFCPEPGETHTTPRVIRAGSFTSFMFDSDVFRAYLAEHDDGRYPHWNKVVHTTSTSLAMKIAALSRALNSDASAMQAQSCFADVVAAVAVEIMGRAPASAARLDPAACAAERIRECLHADRAGLDLNALAKEMGLSRFQVLRTFKRRYGLPPHAYQLSVRVARARQLLVMGMTPADVAAECGFVDQSHFTKHFRRFLGVTPMAYAKAAPGGTAASSRCDWADEP
jgi:AraC-like DNA-binding protein